MSTIHANSALEGLTRLDDLTGARRRRASPYRAITQAINVVIFIERAPNGRRVKEVSRLVGCEGESYQLEALTHSPAQLATRRPLILACPVEPDCGFTDRRRSGRRERKP